MLTPKGFQWTDIDGPNAGQKSKRPYEATHQLSCIGCGSTALSITEGAHKKQAKKQIGTYVRCPTCQGPTQRLHSGARQ